MSNVEQAYENGFMCGRGGYGRNPHNPRTDKQRYQAWQDGHYEGMRERSMMNRENSKNDDWQTSWQTIYSVG